MATDFKPGDWVRTKPGLVGTIASIVHLTAYVNVSPQQDDAIEPCLLSELTQMDSPDKPLLDKE
jgi:hypothetical protein